MGQAITTLLRRLLGGEAQTSLLSYHNNQGRSQEGDEGEQQPPRVKIFSAPAPLPHRKFSGSTRDNNDQESFFDRYRKRGQAVIILRRFPGGGLAGKPPPDPFSSYPGGNCTDIGIDTVNDEKQVVVQGSFSDDKAEGGGNDVVYDQPRWGGLGPYSGCQRILLVGEGDFSFSASLAVAFGNASNMVATSLDSFEFLNKNYKKAMDNIVKLQNRRCKVVHGVDATKMVNHPQLEALKFDCIIYNFPHAGFSKLKEPRNVQIGQHQELVRGFMSNAKEMLEVDGQIHITHKCVGFSKSWNIQMLGSSEGLSLIKVDPFNVGDYPGYSTKYGYGGDKDFDWKPSKTYKFQLASAAKKKKTRRKKK